MAADNNTPEPHDTPETLTPTVSSGTITPPASPRGRTFLTGKWVWVGIAAAASLLAVGIFSAGLMVGKTVGGEHEWHHGSELGKGQSAESDDSEGEESEGTSHQDDAPANDQADESEPANKTPAMTAPAPSTAVAPPSVNSPPPSTAGR